jgi:hypothetical protein
MERTITEASAMALFVRDPLQRTPGEPSQNGVRSAWVTGRYIGKSLIDSAVFFPRDCDRGMLRKPRGRMQKARSERRRAARLSGSERAVAKVAELLCHGQPTRVLQKARRHGQAARGTRRVHRKCFFEPLSMSIQRRRVGAID